MECRVNYNSAHKAQLQLTAQYLSNLQISSLSTLVSKHEMEMQKRLEHMKSHNIINMNQKIETRLEDKDLN